MGAIETVVGPNYNPGSWNPGDDFALVRVSITTSYDRMIFSQASDGYVTDFTMRAHAYPLHESVDPSCDTNLDFSGVDTAANSLDAWGSGAREMVSTFGPISAPVGFDTFHMTLDGGPGFSGSPAWYCGDATCTVGEDAGVVAVWSGWNGFYTTKVGPKVREFRTWGEAVID